MEVQYIDNLEDFGRMREDLLSTDKPLGWDSETSGFDPHTEKLRTFQFATNPDKPYVVDVHKLNDPNLYAPFLDMLADPERSVIAQNGAFDLKFLRKFVGGKAFPVTRFYDTMVVSKLLSFDRYYVLRQDRPHWEETNKHGLGDIASRELGIVLDKALQKSDFSGPLSEEQIQYAARDAGVLLQIYESQVKKVREESLERVARLECDAVPCIADLEYNGFYLDAEAWDERTRQQRVEAEELRKQLYDALTPHCPVIDLWGDPVINIDSPTQLLKTLRLAGIPVESTKEDALKVLKHDHEIVRLLMEYRERATALKKFGPDYLNFINPETDRIHADFQQITAPSGRMSCWKPNLQQLPQDPRFRTPFRAQHGGKIITADYGQIELRIMGMQSRDPQLVKVFMEGISLHKHTCHMVLGEPLDNPDPRKYRIAKNLNFGATYGAGAERFSQVADIRVKEAEDALRGFWQIYYVLDAYMARQGEICAETGIAKTWSGRKVRVNFDKEDRRAYSSATRLGRNFGVQGTGADILKMAGYKIRNKAFEEGLDCRPVNWVHDEIVTETNDDPTRVEELVVSMMKEAGQLVLGDIPCVVDAHTEDTWTK